MTKHRRPTDRPEVRGVPDENLDRVLDHAAEPPEVRRRPLDLQLTGRVQHIIELASPLEEIANGAGIYNVFDDGGYRTLLMLTMFGLTKPPGRLGDDAVDEHGHRLELKTINLIKTNGDLRTTYPGVTTEHTLRKENVERYRACDAWLIGIFKGNQPLDVWVVPSGALEPWYQEWERRIADAPNREINNPKIPMWRVQEVGVCHHIPGSERVPRPQARRPKHAKF